MHSTFLSSTSVFLCVPPYTKRNLFPLKHHYFQETEVQSWLLSFKFIEIFKEKCVRNGHVTSLYPLGCIAHTSFSLQNICWVFLQNKTFMRLPHFPVVEETLRKFVLLRKKLQSLIMNEQVRYMIEIILKESNAFTPSPNHSKRSVKDSNCSS